MSLRPSTLRWRLTLAYAASLAAGFAVLGSLIFALVRYQLLTHHDHALEAAASQVEVVLSQEPDCRVLTPGQMAQLDLIGGLVLFHEAAGGRVFYRSAAAQDVPIPPSRMANTAGSGRGVFEVLPGSPSLRVYSRWYQSRAGTRGVIRVAERLGDVTAPLRSLSVALLLLAPLAVSASAAAGYWLARNALAPVDSVTRLAREIEATSLERRLPPTGVDDEIGRLVSTFNQMIERLESSFDGMKRFTADASHELRAPLSRMRGALDVALAKPRDADAYHQALAGIGDDVDHLRSITEDLLVLARADSGHLNLEREEVRLDVVAAEAVESLMPTAAARGIEIHAQTDGPAVVLGDERWLRQLATDLLDNALKFAPLGARGKRRAEVVVRVTILDQTTTLSVEDTGPGLPPNSSERVFERFFRADTPQPHLAVEGVGLGLAIAAWIVRAHKGAIAAENLEEGGTRIAVRLPLASSESD